MPKLQLISCFVNLAGDRNNVVFRGPENPVTFAEALVLQSIHGGQEHVHTMIDVGSVDRGAEEEMERLTALYGETVSGLFPLLGGRANLPQGDDSIPTLETVNRANAAAQAAMNARQTVAEEKAGQTGAEEPDQAAEEPQGLPEQETEPAGG